MDFNQLAKDLVDEIVAFGVPRTTISKRLGISRQAFYRRLANNHFTTDDLTMLSAMSVASCGGTVLLDFMTPILGGENDG
jgi:hypothetical protein